MKSKEIYESMKKEFNGLFTQYHFKIINKDINSLYVRFVAANKTTGIKVIYEYRDNIINITLYKMNGSLNTDMTLDDLFSNNSNVESLDLNYIISNSDKGDMVLSAYMYDELIDLENWIIKYFNFAYSQLIKYSDGILGGILSNSIMFIKIAVKSINNKKKPAVVVLMSRSPVHVKNVYIMYIFGTVKILSQICLQRWRNSL